MNNYKPKHNIKDDGFEDLGLSTFKCNLIETGNGKIAIPIFSLLPYKLGGKQEVKYVNDKVIFRLTRIYNLNGEHILLTTYGVADCQHGNTYIKEFGVDLAFRKASEAMERKCRKLLQQYSYENMENPK